MAAWEIPELNGHLKGKFTHCWGSSIAMFDCQKIAQISPKPRDTKGGSPTTLQSTNQIRRSGAPRTANTSHGRPIVSTRSCTRCGHVAHSIILACLFQQLPELWWFSPTSDLFWQKAPTSGSCLQHVATPLKDLAASREAWWAKSRPVTRCSALKYFSWLRKMQLCSCDRRKLHRSTHPLHAAVVAVDCSTSSLSRAEMPQASENLCEWCEWCCVATNLRWRDRAMVAMLLCYHLFSIVLLKHWHVRKLFLHWPGIDQPRTSKIPAGESAPAREEVEESPDSPEDRQDSTTVGGKRRVVCYTRLQYTNIL